MINTPKRLRAARISAGLSQDRLAEITGYSRNTITSIEKFTAQVPDIRLPMISEYSRITGVPEMYLLHGSDSLPNARLRLEELRSVIEQNIARTINIIEEDNNPLPYSQKITST